MNQTIAAGRPRVVAIVGPTAVGKTALSLRLALALGGEIVSADSRQIYRGMDIGTAKVSAAERALAPHHLIDVVAPDEELTLAHYRQLAAQAIEGIWGRERLPLLVGGTGLYVRALLEGWTVPEAPPHPELRARLEAQAAREGTQALHAQLQAADPAAAAQIDARNVRRVIRALEVFCATGRPISEQQRKQPPDYAVLKLGLTLEREALYARIDARIDQMMALGLEREVRELVSQGYGFDLPAMSALGYQQLGQYLRGEVGLDEAVALIKRHTRRFVRQQYNWFRLSDASIHWYQADALDVETIIAQVRAFLALP